MPDNVPNSPGAYPEFANPPEGIGNPTEQPSQTLGAIEEAQARIEEHYPEVDDEGNEITQEEPVAEGAPEVPQTQEEIDYKAYQKTIEQFRNLGLKSDEDILAYTQQQQQPAPVEEEDTLDLEVPDLTGIASDTEVPYATQQLAQYLEACEDDDPLVGVASNLDTRLQQLEAIAQQFQTQQQQYQAQQVNMQYYQELQGALSAVDTGLFGGLPGSQPNMTPEQKAAEVLWNDVQQELSAGRRPNVQEIVKSREAQFQSLRDHFVSNYNAEKGSQFEPVRGPEPIPASQIVDKPLDVSQMTTPDEFANAAAAILGGQSRTNNRRFK